MPTSTSLAFGWSYSTGWGSSTADIMDKTAPALSPSLSDRDVQHHLRKPWALHPPSLHGLRCDTSTSFMLWNCFQKLPVQPSHYFTYLELNTQTHTHIESDYHVLGVFQETRELKCSQPPPFVLRARCSQPCVCDNSFLNITHVVIGAFRHLYKKKNQHFFSFMLKLQYENIALRKTFQFRQRTVLTSELFNTHTPNSITLLSPVH